MGDFQRKHGPPWKVDLRLGEEEDESVLEAFQEEKKRQFVTRSTAVVLHKNPNQSPPSVPTEFIRALPPNKTFKKGNVAFTKFSCWISRTLLVPCNPSLQSFCCFTKIQVKHFSFVLFICFGAVSLIGTVTFMVVCFVRLVFSSWWQWRTVSRTPPQGLEGSGHVILIFSAVR